MKASSAWSATFDDESKYPAMLEALIRKPNSLRAQTQYPQEQYDVILT